MKNPSWENVPLKKELPCLAFDMSLHAEQILLTVNCEFPPYLEEFKKNLIQLKKSKKTNQPKQFSEDFRLYIFDNRLLPLYASIYKASPYLFNFREFCRFQLEESDYVFGDGSSPRTGGMPLSEDFELRMTKMCSFDYGFVAHDCLAMNTLMIAQGDILKEHRYISAYQTAFLLHKFKNKNLIDWNLITKDELSFC